VGRHAIDEDPLRPFACFERVQVIYPATVSRIVQQALELNIPEDAELVVHTKYDEDGPQVFFEWPVYSDEVGNGKHARFGRTDVPAAQPSRRPDAGDVGKAA
jgi:hypothetical protein